jgi:hypothetical protein
MPITTSVDNDKQLTTHTVIGEISFEEVMTTLRQFWEGQLTISVLWDFRKGSMARFSFIEIERVADYVTFQAEKRTGRKTATVVSRESEYGLSRLINTLRVIRKVPLQLKIFRSMEEANQWLDEEE